MPVLLANAKADASGKATITFPAPGQGMAYCGTVIVPSTPGGAAWTAMIGNATYGQWSGSAMAGPFTENDQETLQLVGTGLVAGTTYVATWHITQGASGSFRGVVPDVLPASISIANATIPVTGTVDATIQNATLDVTGSTINVDGATQATSTFGTVNASAQDTVTVTATSSPTTLIPAPSSTERLQLFSGNMAPPTGTPTSAINLQTTTGTVISLGPMSSTDVSLQYDGATLPAGEGVVISGASSSVNVSVTLNYSVISA